MMLQACGTRGRAPYDAVLTYGFTLDENGMKMSKSLRNTTAPEDVIRQYGADILRLWVAQSDYSADLRIDTTEVPEQSAVEQSLTLLQSAVPSGSKTADH